MTYTACERSRAQVTLPVIEQQHGKRTWNMEGDFFPVKFLLYMTVSCVLYGSCSGLFMPQELCYGRNFSLPDLFAPPLYKGKMFFTPNNGGPRRLMMENGESKDPRLKVSVRSALLTDVRESDEGTFTIFFVANIPSTINLRIRDCSSKVQRKYGEMFSANVPRQTEFLEFTPSGSGGQTIVLWNRTNPQSNKGGSGQMRHNLWEIKSVTQTDNGHYNFRKKDNTLMSRILLKVEEIKRSYDTKAKRQLIIHNPSVVTSWTVKHIPDNGIGGEMVLREGRSPEYDFNTRNFNGRLQVVRNSIEIDPVDEGDSGTFEFRDEQGNLAQTVRVNVEPEISSLGYIGIAVLIFVMIIACCCVKWCCCKLNASKADQPAAAPAVRHHDHNQPAGPSYSAAPATDYSYQPMISSVPKEPATTRFGSSVYNPVNVHVNPPEPEVKGGPVASLNPDGPSSDPEPRFELKGLTFSSAPPLSSDSTFCDVYTSEKLNFL